MKILVLTSDAFGGYGGTAKYNQDLLAAFCAYPQCTEVVAVPRYLGHPMEALPSKLTYVTSGVNSKLRYVQAVVDVVRRHRHFDLIVCAHIHLLPIIYPLRLLYPRAPLVLVMYGFDAWSPTGRRITDCLARKVDAFISISELTQNGFLHWTGVESEKGFLLPCAVNLSGYAPGPKSETLLKRYGLVGKTVLLTVGRLAATDRYKGFDEVMELLPALAQHVPDVAYLIVGDGADRPRLEEKARTLGIEQQVVFAGLIPEVEKADHYRLADVYVMPGRKEGFGIVYLEAMACGIPVVASKVDGSREAVRNGALGILVNPDDPEEIKAGILAALERPKGVVPKGLEYFSYSRFEQRCHRIIDRMAAWRHRTGAVA